MNVAKIMINQIVKKLEKRYSKEINSLYFEMNFLSKEMTVEIGEIKETKKITDSDLDSADIFISLITKKMREQKIDTDSISADLVIIDLTIKPEFSDNTKFYFSQSGNKQFINLKNILS